MRCSFTALFSVDIEHVIYREDEDRHIAFSLLFMMKSFAFCADFCVYLFAVQAIYLSIDLPVNYLAKWVNMW